MADNKTMAWEELIGDNGRNDMFYRDVCYQYDDRDGCFYDLVDGNEIEEGDRIYVVVGRCRSALVMGSDTYGEHSDLFDMLGCYVYSTTFYGSGEDLEEAVSWALFEEKNH